MIKNFIVDSTCKNMRIDRYLKNKLGRIPQSLIEKCLRSGKIKLNKKNNAQKVIDISGNAGPVINKTGTNIKINKKKLLVILIDP